MDDPCKLFRLQHKKAKDSLDALLIVKAEINSKLESDYSNPYLQKDLRTVNMDIKITENEIEHAEFRIKECETKQDSFVN